jgi:hypothetical protein
VSWIAGVLHLLAGGLLAVNYQPRIHTIKSPTTLTRSKTRGQRSSCTDFARLVLGNAHGLQKSGVESVLSGRLNHLDEKSANRRLRADDTPEVTRKGRALYGQMKRMHS